MRSRILAAILAAAALSLAACSSGSSQPSSNGSSSSSGTAPSGTPTAQTLLNEALAALRAASSVRITGGVIQNGKNLHFDVAFIRSGGASGTISGPFLTGAPATFKIIIAGGKGYVLLDKQFFNALSKAHHIPSSACSLLCGKYIAVPASQFGDFSLNGLTRAELSGASKAAPGVTTTTINGQPAFRISDGRGSYLYIARNGTHYPLEITKPGSGALVFSEWNAVPPITPPPASQVVSVPGGIG
jgi:hypothetical protein